MPYRGRKEEHPLISWFLGSVCMGLLPTVIKFLILKISHSDISPNQFHTELFYLSLVLLADIIKNTSKEYVRWKAAFICTIIYSGIYAYILCGDLGLLAEGRAVSSQAALVFSFASIGVGTVLGLITIYTGGEKP